MIKPHTFLEELKNLVVVCSSFQSCSKWNILWFANFKLFNIQYIQFMLNFVPVNYDRTVLDIIHIKYCLFILNNYKLLINTRTTPKFH